ncbi:hypothetical protein D9758_016455 [Tetrapyrgos nigripes]|uniref:Uncharacterized protein n=1 Tax=Tetrapyrgos nigripes TaxID=182062 RepID=A0A8H5CCA6_9AGAR|nr:hypothetical protein D9758_016455 [Tetrapyrgos nigripes]
MISLRALIIDRREENEDEKINREEDDMSGYSVGSHAINWVDLDTGFCAWDLITPYAESCIQMRSWVGPCGSSELSNGAGAIISSPAGLTHLYLRMKSEWPRFEFKEKVVFGPASAVKP